MVYYIVSGLFLMFFWCPCMAINVNVQYNGGLLPDIILLTQCLKKNQTTPRPSEHPLVMGEKMSKRSPVGGIKRLQIQTHFMAFKQIPRCR